MTLRKGIFYAFVLSYAIADGVFSTISVMHSRDAYETCYAIFFLVGAPLPFIWYYLDSSERSFQRTTGLKLLIILLALVGIPVYLFKSRPWKKALVGTAIFILVIVGVAITTSITSNITLRLIEHV
jgi:hypothetical protein